ncbi:uncharacterized protein LOC115232091 [Octopus sinensis]|uniref:Uncharacterized protein LOC115232091 n=1 Tax=Octopus sinensis TaxID=2607531 RepID=A0A6P7U1J0_9MOLL|nr:uncharacterized protein LOC115232091 [Octopus sinensis]
MPNLALIARFSSNLGFFFNLPTNQNPEIIKDTMGNICKKSAFPHIKIHNDHLNEETLGNISSVDYNDLVGLEDESFDEDIDQEWDEDDVDEYTEENRDEDSDEYFEESDDDLNNN